MLPIAPLDYERYTVALNPLLVAETGHNAIPVPSRSTEPVTPSTTTQRQQKPLAQGLSSHAGEDVGSDRVAGIGGDGPGAISSSSSAELSSVIGISPEVLFAGEGNSEITSRAVTQRYELSSDKPFATIKVSA